MVKSEILSLLQEDIGDNLQLLFSKKLVKKKVYVHVNNDTVASRLS